eukprot:2569331-Rhodomonas_salina.2
MQRLALRGERFCRGEEIREILPYPAAEAFRMRVGEANFFAGGDDDDGFFRSLTHETGLTQLTYQMFQTCRRGSRQRLHEQSEEGFVGFGVT